MCISDWSSDVCSSDLVGVLVIERLVVVVDLGHVWIGEDVGEDPPFTAYARLDLAVCFPPPAALPFVLVLPVLGIADTGLALDVVPPVVLGPFAGGPDLLADRKRTRLNSSH